MPRPSGPKRGAQARRVRLTSHQKSLITATDHGHPVKIDAALFAPAKRDPGWGPFLETFLRINSTALKTLEIEPEITGSSDGAVLRLRPGGRAGAIPLLAPASGKVAGGLVVSPRFGWSGVGHILGEIGWHAGPQFTELPLVPGSGREVPPWVLAGPVLARLEQLLKSLRRGYQDLETETRKPRGRILWDRYVKTSLAHGQWDKVPCRFPDLELDPVLRREVRWVLEKVHRELGVAGGTDSIASSLAALAVRLINQLSDVSPVYPRLGELDRRLSSDKMISENIKRGLQAMSWIVHERGLGGGREQDGLAWSLPLERLWEQYVEAQVRIDAKLTGATVRSGRLRETVFPIEWSDPVHRSLGHLHPDLIVTRGSHVEVIDAKYKAHLAELDEAGWHNFEAQAKEAHRADVHQALAYAALFNAKSVTATLIYPLRHSTYAALKQRGRTVSKASLRYGGRDITLQLKGLPFGKVS